MQKQNWKKRNKKYGTRQRKRKKEKSGKIINLAVFFFVECAINQQKMRSNILIEEN